MTNHDGLDELLSETESTVRRCDNVDNDFLADLVNDYETKTQFGPNVSETLGKLVCNAIDSALPEQEDKKLREKYLIPEKCQSLRVPKVNRELWTAFKLKRASDLALQSTQTYLSLAIVPVIKSLTLVNIYAPNTDSPSFSRNIFDILNCSDENDYVIICGD
jgi:hypothetical protein